MSTNKNSRFMLVGKRTRTFAMFLLVGKLTSTEVRFSVDLSLGQIALCAVLCQDLGLYLWLEGKINLWGAVGVSLFRVWLTWEETPCQVRDCCKYLSVEGYHKESLCLQRNSFWYLSRCAVPS